MVIKKPYAFLIKHFRAIHLLLLIPMFYLIIKTKAIVGFFAEYIARDYSLNFVGMLDHLSSNYINVLMYVAVIVILVTFIAMSLLLQNKNKPTKFYNWSIVYYFVIFILITTSFGIFQMIETDSLSNTFARIIRDISYIIHYSQYILVFLIIVRGVGFDIKKFNFQSDLVDLEISSEDSEEVEFLVGNEIYKTKRTIRRFFRELKYYYKENKFIVIAIGVLVVGVGGTIIYMNRNVYDKDYKLNETLSFGNLNIMVKNAYISNLSSNGKEINKDKTYVILQLNIKNRYREDKEFNASNFQLEIGKEKISPNISVSHHFTDFGNPFNGTLIKGQTELPYIIVYEIDKSVQNKKMNISVFSSFDVTKGGIGVISKSINFKPTTINSKVTTNNVNRGTNTSYKSTNLKNTTATIINYELTDYYTYKTENCITEEKCYSIDNYISISGSDLYRQTLMVLEYDLELDNNSPYMYFDKNYRSFFEDFMQIKYTFGGKDYSTNIKLENPANYEDRLIIKVPSDINKAESINAIITVRNISYNIKLK